MKITINQLDLLEALTQLHRISDPRNTMPILGYVVIESMNESEIKICSSNLTSQLVVRLPANCNNVYDSFCLPAERFLDICKALPKNSVIHLTDADGKIKLQAGRSRFMLGKIPGEEFPQFMTADCQHSFTIHSTKFADMLRKTILFSSDDTSRFTFNGVCLCNEKGLTLVATDSHRLVVLDDPSINIGEGAPSIIIPKVTAREIINLLNAHSKDCTIKFSDKFISVDLPTCQYVSKLVQGRFPNYRKIIPQHGSDEIIARINTKALLESIKRISTITDEKSRGIVFNFSSPNHLHLDCNNPDQELSEEDMDVVYNGPDFQAGFNYRYIQESTVPICGEEMIWSLNGKEPEAPALIRDSENDNVIVVLMPMRV